MNNPNAWKEAATLQWKRMVRSIQYSAQAHKALRQGAKLRNSQVDAIKQYLLGIANPASKTTAKKQ